MERASVNGESRPASLLQASDALFRPVRAGNAFEEAVERLLTAIKLGIVGPGERLPAERDLAKRLGVSRVTLREAIRALQEAHYVEVRRGRYGGTFVSARIPRPTRADVRRRARQMVSELDDALLLREVLEIGAAEQAASRTLGEAERDHLRQRLEQLATAGDLADYRRKDARLHLAIAEVTGSPSLTATVADARMRVSTLLDAIPVLPANLAHADEQHAAIVAAILAGDPEEARRVTAEHLAGTAALLRGFLG